VREFAPKLFIPAGISILIIMLIIGWQADREKRINQENGKDVGVRSG